MPKLTVEGVGEFEVPAGKRLVLALTDEAKVDQLHACGGNARCTTCRVEFVAGEPDQMTVAEKNVLAAKGRHRRPPQLPDPLRPRHDRPRHQPARRQRPGQRRQPARRHDPARTRHLDHEVSPALPPPIAIHPAEAPARRCSASSLPRRPARRRLARSSAAPTGQGHAKARTLAHRVEAGRRTSLWKQDVPGSGWSSPVVVGGKVYLDQRRARSTDSKDLSLRALCLDARTARPLEQRGLPPGRARSRRGIHSKNSHASPTPIVEGDRLYVHFGHQGTACLDLAGKVLWTQPRR